MKDRLYEFRGKKVMLDSDLAEIYGYETKNFKRQVKNNIAKFEGDDFMFELNDVEVENLSRCKNFTLNMGRGSNIKYKPYVFTEQGVYMLMTVLRGDLAIKQSRALVKTFKKMKDYILENRDLIGQRELLQLSMETANNRIEINKINSDMISLEKQISDVAEGLKDVVTKSELADMMNSFVSDDDEKWLMFNANRKVVIIPAIIHFQLFGKVLKRIKSMSCIKTLIILSVASFIFPVMSWCKRSYNFIANPMLLQMHLK